MLYLVFVFILNILGIEVTMCNNLNAIFGAHCPVYGYFWIGFIIAWILE